MGEKCFFSLLMVFQVDILIYTWLNAHFSRHDKCMSNRGEKKQF